MDKIISVTQFTSITGEKGHTRFSVESADHSAAKTHGNLDVLFKSAEQLFAAGYVTCYEQWLMIVAYENQIKITTTCVSARVTLLESETGYHFNTELEVSLCGISSAVGHKILEIAHSRCQYSKAVLGNVAVKTILVCV